MFGTNFTFGCSDALRVFVLTGNFLLLGVVLSVRDGHTTHVRWGGAGGHRQRVGQIEKNKVKSAHTNSGAKIKFNRSLAYFVDPLRIDYLYARVFVRAPPADFPVLRICKWPAMIPLALQKNECARLGEHGGVSLFANAPAAVVLLFLPHAITHTSAPFKQQHKKNTMRINRLAK